MFLGGVGAGAYLTTFFVKIGLLAQAKKSYQLQENGQTTRSPQKIRSRLLIQYSGVMSRMQRSWLWSIFVSFVIICVSALCLFKDLTVPSRALLLFIKPTISVISVGSYILAALILTLALLLSIELVFKRMRKHVVTAILEIIAAVLSVGMMVYTGIFLMNIAAVPLWSSVFLPLVFLLSSCSGGIAVTMLLFAYLRRRQPFFQTTLFALLKVDTIVVVLEALVFFFMYWNVRSNVAAALSFEQLLTGTYMQQFWIGFVFCAILVPIIVSLICYFLKPKNVVRISTFSACSVLLGGFFMRYCLVVAGVHTSTVMFI